jgi:hypothetical protein
LIFLILEVKRLDFAQPERAAGLSIPRGLTGAAARANVETRQPTGSSAMSDETKTPPEAQPQEPHDRFSGEHHQPKKGVKDAGEIVESAGELIDGRIADITDGDR